MVDRLYLFSGATINDFGLGDAFILRDLQCFQRQRSLLFRVIMPLKVAYRWAVDTEQTRKPPEYRPYQKILKARNMIDIDVVTFENVSLVFHNNNNRFYFFAKLPIHIKS